MILICVEIFNEHFIFSILSQQWLSFHSSLLENSIKIASYSMRKPVGASLSFALTS